MKQYATRFLKAIAILFMGFPIFYIVSVALLFDVPLNACGSILLSPFYYLISIFAIAAGYGLWEMKRWSWYFFLISQVLILYETFFVAVSYAETHHQVFALVFSMVVQMGIVYQVSREIRVPYFFPKIRWWESNPRYRLNIPVSVVISQGDVLSGEILDLSMAGCFVKTRSDLSLSQEVTVRFKAYGQDLQCQGELVWAALSAVTHPKGVGIKFLPLDKTQKRSLRLIGRKLRKVARHYRQHRYLMSTQEFMAKLEELEGFDGQNSDLDE